MKSLAMIGTLLGALATAACDVGEPMEATDQQSLDAAGSAESRDLPADLSFDAIKPHVIVPHPGGCRISIVCHNPAFGNIPTFCTNGAPCQGNGPIWAPADCLANCPQPGTSCALGHNLTQMRQCL